MHSEYPEFGLLRGVDFRTLDRRGAKAFFQAFMAEVPGRLKVLEGAVGTIAGDVRLDFSEQSLLAVSELCVHAATARVRSDEDLAALKSQLRPAWSFLELDRFVPDSSTLSLGVDSSIYLAECLRTRFPVLAWSLSPEGPRCADYNRPVVWGFPWGIAFEPIRTGSITAIKALKGEVVALDRLLMEWCKTANGVA